MTDPDPDLAARRELSRHRALATGLLAATGGLTLGSYALPPGYWTDLLQASAKAGFVGGIADWFAVAALFRHPLGIPIPHTAIIPRQKDRLGRALGRFVATNVFSEEDVAKILAGLDVPGILRGFLTEPASSGPAAVALAGALPRLLATIEDGRARRLLRRLLPRLLGGANAGPMIARILQGLVDGRQHQDVFGFILTQLRAALASHEETLRAAIAERVREQGGRLMGWTLGATIARRVLVQINAELDRISPDGSELRAAFDEWVRREIQRLETDPPRTAELAITLRRLLAHESVQTWLWDVWARLRTAFAEDAMRANGRSAQFLQGLFANLGVMLETDPAARERVQGAADAILRSLLPAARERLADFIAAIVSGWDTRTITDRLELRVGKDLQYVRMNGTLVGFLVGGGLYALLRAIFGSVSF